VSDAADFYNPPLTWWGHVWRTTASFLISGLAWGDIAVHQWHRNPGLAWLDLAGGVLATVLMFYRRRWPFQVALLVALLGFVSVSSAGPAVITLISLATRRRYVGIAVVGVSGIVAGQVFSAYEPDPNGGGPLLTFTFSVLVTVALSVLGLYLGSRRELLWTLRLRAAQAESEQELRVDQARSAERERIAREMHDVLAHRISLVTMHAGALAYRTDLPPEQIRETAQIIQAKAHEALADLRQVLGVLRSPDGIGDRPQPTYGDLETLVAEATAGGMVIDFASSLPYGLQPPDQVGRTAYRVVQEALTNARKHAVGAHVAVTINGAREDGLTVAVRNANRVGALGMPVTPGSGLGLIGLRERAELAGGSLTVVRTDDAFTLRCWLPWTT
jgi:signal transduction histidine kinase